LTAVAVGAALFASGVTSSSTAASAAAAPASVDSKYSLPADGIPLYNLSKTSGVRDASAAAIAASGLLDLSQGSSSQAILLHSSRSDASWDAGSGWGDYYFVEALLRLRGIWMPGDGFGGSG
jgi:hypothetical protein